MLSFLSIRNLLSLFLVIVLSGCVSSSIDPSRFEKTPSFTIINDKPTRLDDYFSREVASHSLIDETGFYPLDRGHDALLARLAIIETAQASIDVQYYIFRDDEAGNLLAWRLFEAAERGVRVRLLLDDMQKYDDNDLVRFSSHPNIEVRMFNPHHLRSARGIAMLSDFERLNHRMHNKSLTVDGVVSIIGGRNVGNEYYSIESNVEFSDLDLLMVGKSVRQVNRQFDLYWNSDYSVPVEWLTSKRLQYTDADVEVWVNELGLEEKFSGGTYDFSKLPLYSDLINGTIELYWGVGNLLYDLPNKPDSKQSTLIDSLGAVLEEGKSSLVLISPYFVPTESGTKELIQAVKDGREVIIITNSLASNDVFAVHGWYAKYRKQLVEGGVQLWEVKSNAEIKKNWSLTGSSRSSLHTKAVVIDKKKLFVGSMNWDPRSAHLNTEMGVVIEQHEYAQKVYREILREIPTTAYEIQVVDDDVVWFDHTTGDTLTSEPDASFWRRMGAWFSGVLPIEEQL
ncbi:phospholipase D family protein [Vibrio hangzhouensis]|uniref:Phosphatidylserine/phosphatidylglycerophosphate/cardiolipin synthase n=1 Tax=Vibrio hangzhouensis TaxID=462991 RepID=A0A1H5T607_9VIBR|nr:phospholipase D family protein [Vibrio hangzhouensis]SEF58219.1 Phosphatidylserine/phosphatidylglycerophosphate/cardiolipin synthase [Vibrio hangzhouensis]